MMVNNLIAVRLSEALDRPDNGSPELGSNGQRNPRPTSNRLGTALPVALSAGHHARHSVPVFLEAKVDGIQGRMGGSRLLAGANSFSTFLLGLAAGWSLFGWIVAPLAFNAVAVATMAAGVHGGVSRDCAVGHRSSFAYSLLRLPFYFSGIVVTSASSRRAGRYRVVSVWRTSSSCRKLTSGSISCSFRDLVCWVHCLARLACRLRQCPSFGGRALAATDGYRRPPDRASRAQVLLAM